MNTPVSSVTGLIMWTARVWCVLGLVCALALADDSDSRTVVIEQGPIRGYRAPEGGLFVFHNIPYATAPTGKDRFKAPLPAPVWISTREAVDMGVICLQQNIVIGNISFIVNKTMQEDCLIANVYVPDTSEKNIPVVIIVHGGAYQMGFGDMLTPKDLVQSKKIIAVTFNYRLGVHGFLCLGTPDVPGNAGMKDQLAALRWVQKNIAMFGGNPGDVTLQGYSAGSSAVDLLLLSKAAEGLFHRAIPESGANVASWSVQIDPVANAKQFAIEHNFENADDTYALEEFYKYSTFDFLFKDTLNPLLRKDSNFLFSPCVERDTGVENFLDDYPVNILKKGTYKKVPMLYGFSNMEGLLRVYNGFQQHAEGMNKEFSDYLPHDLQFKDEKEKKQVARKIKKFYFGDKKIDNDTILEYIDYHTDFIFAYPTLRSLKLQVEAGNDKIYLYHYSFSYGDTPMLPVGVDVKVKGANHCAQTMSVLDELLIPHDGNNGENEIPDEINKIRNITRQFWLNFMTKSSPVPAGSDLPAWPAADAHRSPHMDIALPPQLRGELLPQRVRFWDDLYERYYRAPAPPPAPPQRRTEL